MSQDIMKQIQIFCTQFSEVLFFDLLGLGFVFVFSFAFLFCFQRGIKIFSWKKFCICSREMGQKWIPKNFRVV